MNIFNITETLRPKLHSFHATCSTRISTRIGKVKTFVDKIEKILIRADRHLPNHFIRHLIGLHQTLTHYYNVQSKDYLLKHYPRGQDLLNYRSKNSPGHQGDFSPNHGVFEHFSSIGSWYFEIIASTLVDHRFVETCIQIVSRRTAAIRGAHTTKVHRIRGQTNNGSHDFIFLFSIEKILWNDVISISNYVTSHYTTDLIYLLLSQIILKMRKSVSRKIRKNLSQKIETFTKKDSIFITEITSWG